VGPGKNTFNPLQLIVADYVSDTMLGVRTKQVNLTRALVFKSLRICQDGQTQTTNYNTICEVLRNWFPVNISVSSNICGLGSFVFLLLFILKVKAVKKKCEKAQLSFY